MFNIIKLTLPWQPVLLHTLYTRWQHSSRQMLTQTHCQLNNWGKKLTTLTKEHDHHNTLIVLRLVSVVEIDEIGHWYMAFLFSYRATYISLFSPYPIKGQGWKRVRWQGEGGGAQKEMKNYIQCRMLFGEAELKCSVNKVYIVFEESKKCGTNHSICWHQKGQMSCHVPQVNDPFYFGCIDQP